MRGGNVLQFTPDVHGTTEASTGQRSPAREARPRKLPARLLAPTRYTETEAVAAARAGCATRKAFRVYVMARRLALVPEVMSVPEAAWCLGVELKWMRRAVAAGYLPAEESRLRKVDVERLGASLCT